MSGLVKKGWNSSAELIARWWGLWGGGGNEWDEEAGMDCSPSWVVICYVRPLGWGSKGDAGVVKEKGWLYHLQRWWKGCKKGFGVTGVGVMTLCREGRCWMLGGGMDLTSEVVGERDVWLVTDVTSGSAELVFPHWYSNRTFLSFEIISPCQCRSNTYNI